MSRRITANSASPAPGPRPSCCTISRSRDRPTRARGPYRGSGDFALDGGRRATFALASEPFAGDALPIKADIASGPARIDFDGRVVFGAKPALAGAATLTGEAPTPEGGVWPWRASGDLTLSGDAAEMSGGRFPARAGRARDRGVGPGQARARRGALARRRVDGQEPQPRLRCCGATRSLTRRRPARSPPSRPSPAARSAGARR